MKFSSKRILRLNKPIHDIVVVSNAKPDPSSAGNSDLSADRPPEEEKFLEITEKEFQKKIDLAYQKGREEGLLDGHQEAKSEFVETFQALREMIANFEDKQRVILEHSEKTILDLIFRVIHKIVPVISAKQTDIIEVTLRKLLKSYQAAGRIKIMLNPENVETIRRIIPEIRTQLPDMKELNLVADAGIPSGGCILETDLGKIDARIETQLAELEKELRNTFQKL